GGRSAGGRLVSRQGRRGAAARGRPAAHLRLSGSRRGRRRASRAPSDAGGCASGWPGRRDVRHSRAAMGENQWGPPKTDVIETPHADFLPLNPHLDGAKVGLIVPSVNTTTEPEFAWISPPHISFHAARVFMNVTTAEALRVMNAEVRRAAELLATLSPD